MNSYFQQSYCVANIESVTDDAVTGKIDLLTQKFERLKIPWRNNSDKQNLSVGLAMPVDNWTTSSRA